MENITIDEALIIRYFSDDVTPKERLAVSNWIDESEENQREAERIYYIKYAGDTIHTIRSINTHADLDKVWKKIRNHNIRLRTMWLQQAAAIACLFLIPVLVYLLLHNRDNGLTGMMLHVPEGSVSSMILPDGSKVWLNAGSQLTCDHGYGVSNRRLQLSGEGFFEVKANVRLPFEVDADGIVVRARGTKFNVKAYPDEHTVSAILTEGEIEIITSGENQRKTISQPGQMTVYNRTNSTSKTETRQPSEKQMAEVNRPATQLAVESIVNTEAYISWKDQRWLVEGSTMGELAPILQRRYAVKVMFDNEILKTYKFRGEIPNLTVEQVARTLQLTAPMNFRMSNDTVFFTLDVKRKKEFDQFINK